MCKAMRQICKIAEYFVELELFFRGPFSPGLLRRIMLHSITKGSHYHGIFQQTVR